MSTEWHSKTTMYEQKIQTYHHENEQLKRRLADYENKIGMLTNEI